MKDLSRIGFIPTFQANSGVPGGWEPDGGGHVVRLEHLEGRFQDILAKALLRNDADATFQPIAANAELYRLLDKVVSWALSGEKRPLAFDARDFPIDLNEACGVLTGIDEGTLWRNLATSIDRIAVFWSAVQWATDDEKKNEHFQKMQEAIQESFGIYIGFIGGGGEDKRAQGIRRLKERLEREERNVRLTQAAIEALERAPPELPPDSSPQVNP